MEYFIGGTVFQDEQDENAATIKRDFRDDDLPGSRFQDLLGFRTTPQTPGT
jgi:hypothetical protein